MNFTFDDYKKIKDPIAYLCNPDMKCLGALNCYNRNVTLRFNDLSELSLTVPSKVVNAFGEEVDTPMFDLLETRRLIHIPEIGWFQITSVEEVEDAEGIYKEISAQSHQCVLKERGIFVEERVYKFYNTLDPKDEKYNSDDATSVPSVVGQLYNQLGIQVSLGDAEDQDHDDWTIIYISESLRYDNTGIARTFTKKESVYGYDFIMNDVSEAFGAVFVFDIAHHSIYIKKDDEAISPSDIYLSLDNVINSMTVTENADDVVTVLNCFGNDLDLSYVNPIGTNYLVDFSYYMDETEGKWMSSVLIRGLKKWQKQVEDKKETYSQLVQDLVPLYESLSSLKIQREEYFLRHKDLVTARDQCLQDKNLVGMPILVETVPLGEKTIHQNLISTSQKYTCYNAPPVYNINNTANSQVPPYTPADGWQSSYDTLKNCYLNGYQYLPIAGHGYPNKYIGYYKIGVQSDENISLYHTSVNAEGDDNALVSDAVDKLGISPKSGDFLIIDVMSGSAIIETKIFNYEESWILQTDLRKYNEHLDNLCVRSYVVNQFKVLEEGKDAYYVTYLTNYINKYNELITKNDSYIESKETEIGQKQSEIKAISDELNIINFFSDRPDLLRELRSYWIEGDYINESLAVLDSTEPSDIKELADQLYELGQKELKKICKPRFTMTVDAINFFNIYEFRENTNSLELGKTLVVEKNPDLHYYPALTEISFSLDDEDDFSLVFSNQIYKNGWGATYADIMASVASTSRSVRANWNDLTAYTRDEAEISNLIRNPLDTTLQAMFSNANNQEFVIDNTGVLGRKKKLDTGTDSTLAFEQEQLRIINNCIVFTDDGWNTAKTALGKIYYTDPNTGEEKISYGLVAETIIGSIMMSERTKIISDGSTISLDDKGITIQKTDGSVVFKADTDGNILLNGSIVWGADNSPTQIVYSTTASDKPVNGTKLSSFPEDSATGWHTKYTSDDYFASYTYDGGSTWTEAIRIAGVNGAPGNNGDTVYVAYLYYRKSDSSAPTSPTYTGNNVLPAGWSPTPQGVTPAKPYVFVSQCTVTNGVYGTWSTPVCWAKYGTDGAPGNNGDTVYVTYLYYRKSNSSAPSKPSYSGGTLPSGWSTTPQGVTATYPYVFVSQCTVTNGVYGTWSTPVCWAKYGANGASGSDASVTTINMFNAVTNNGQKQGCFMLDNGELAINAAYIKSGQIDSDLIFAGEIAASKGTIADWAMIESGFLYKGDSTGATANCVGLYSGASYKYNSSPIRFFAGGTYGKLTDSKFIVTENGSFYSTKGKIGGFNINSTSLITDVYTLNGTSRLTGIRAPSSNHTSSDAALAIGYRNGYAWSDASFYVTFDGKVVAKNLTIPKTGYVYLDNGADTSSTLCPDELFLFSGEEQEVVDDAKYSPGISITPMYIAFKSHYSKNGAGTSYTSGGIENHYAGEASDRYISLIGTWKTSAGAAVTSDARLKNHIEYIDERYNTLFDNLQSRRFQYNDGTSSRYHVGYIAQEVQTALSAAGISDKEFAALCSFNGFDGEKTMGLRYDEFVSLNTWQIQKLKTRVAELENQISLLLKQNEEKELSE